MLLKADCHGLEKLKAFCRWFDAAFEENEVTQAMTDEEFVRGNSTRVHMDDAGENPEFFRHPHVRFMASNGRHYGVELWVTAQRLMQCHPSVRENLDYVFLLSEVDMATRKAMFRKFGGICVTFAVFDAIFQYATRDHGALVIATTGTPQRIRDCMWVARIPPPWLCYFHGMERPGYLEKKIRAYRDHIPSGVSNAPITFIEFHQGGSEAFRRECAQRTLTAEQRVRLRKRGLRQQVPRVDSSCLSRFWE